MIDAEVLQIGRVILEAAVPFLFYFKQMIVEKGDSTYVINYEIIMNGRTVFYLKY